MTIQEAQAQQATYYPNEAIATQLRHITLFLFIGPSAIGKSTTLDKVSQIDSRFGRTGSIGTRPLSERDTPGFYQQLSEEELLAKIAAGEVVQYAVHPTTGHIYATTLNMYQATFNMLECQTLAVEQFHRLPFGKLRVFYMVSEAKAWRGWFEQRYPIHDNERIKRAHEAVLSLEWGMSQPPGSIFWIQNTPDNQEKTAERIIQSTILEEPFDNLRNMAKDMLQVAKEL